MQFRMPVFTDIGGRSVVAVSMGTATATAGVLFIFVE